MEQNKMNAIDIMKLLQEQNYKFSQLPFNSDLAKMYMNICKMASKMSRLEVLYRQTCRQSVLEEIQTCREEIFAAKKLLDQFLIMSKLMS